MNDVGLAGLGGRLGYFHAPSEPNSNLLRVPVRNVVLPVIGLSSLAMEKAPLRSGIASFSRCSESYSEGHHVFILECHFAHGGDSGVLVQPRSERVGLDPVRL
jgi:hypothetical protein